MRRSFALALSLALSGCPGPERSGPFALHIAVAGEFAPFRPRANTTFTVSALDLVYQPVLRVNGRGEILPGCVRRWERLAPDRVRVELDPDLRFSDGSRVSPEDLIRSVAASGLTAHHAGEWLEIGPGTSRDPLEVALLYTTVTRDAAPAPLGTGPFRLVEADARRILLERVHPEPGRVARVEAEAVATSRDAFARALRGEANAVVTLDERQSELMEGVPGLRLVRGQAPHALAVVMNATRFSQEERVALAASMPLDELAQAYGGNCSPLDAASPRKPVPRGPPLQVAASTHDPGLPRAALALRRALGTRGGDLAVEELARARKRAVTRDFDLFVTTVVAWPQVVLGWFARTGAGANLAGYSNPLADEAFDRGDMDAVLEELRRNPPLVLVCRRERIAAVDARIKNATLGVWGLLETLPDWEVSP